MYKSKFIISFLFFILIASISSANAQTSECKPIDFNLIPSYQTGKDAFKFISGDFNDDGKIDVATLSFNTNTISILRGDGLGGFAPPQNYPTEMSIGFFTVGDLNRDGKLDLIGASRYNNKILVKLNDGQGGFPTGTVTTYPSSVYDMHNIKVVDINGDGNPDVVSANDQNLGIFLGDGQGGLALSSTVNWDGNESDIIVGNFNGDNVPDIAVTKRADFPWEVGIMFGSQNGGFIINNRYPLTGEPTGLIAEDLNGDNLTDIAFAAYYPFQNTTPQTFFLEPWFGNGNGGFTGGTKIQFPFVNDGVFAGDFNNDGKLDLATRLGAIIAVVIGNDDGTFQKDSYWAIPSANSILSADVNQDTKQDLLVLTAGFPNSLVSVLINSDNGVFDAPKAVPYRTSEVEAADFNNDGLKDYISAWKTSGYTSEVVVALNDGNEGLLPDQNFTTPLSLEEIKTGDFNGDGNLDAITAHSNSTKPLAVFFGDGTGSVGEYISTSLNVPLKNIIVGKFDSDNKDDVFAVDGSGRVYSLLSNGDGTFTTAPNFPVNLQDSNSKLEIGDFNNDNNLDVVIAYGSGIKLWLGDGTGQFTALSSNIPISGFPVAGDFNGDGNLDLAVLANGGVQGVTGDGSGGFGNVFSLQISGGNGRSLISGDFNLDGSDDLAFAVTLNTFRNLVIVPSSGGQTPIWETPVVYSLGGLDAYTASLIAADFDSDGKADIGFNASSSRGVIYNTSGQNPCISINDVTITEGDEENVTADFAVNLSSSSEKDVYVNYSLEGQNATIGTDLQNLSGRLKIPAGETSGNIPVTISGDLIDEFDETFIVKLSSPSNASLQGSVAVGTILDNDAAPTLTITDVSKDEGIFSESFKFDISLSAPSGKPISFEYSTEEGTATEGVDYFAPSNNTFNIQEGISSAEIYITVRGDNTYEPDETFFLNLSNGSNITINDDQAQATIVNDDQVPTLNVFANVVFEGDTGVTASEYTLQLSNPTYLPVTLNVLTSDGTAVSGSDYEAQDTPVTIPAEQQSLTTIVYVKGDTINEPNETFNVNVYNVNNATIGAPQSQVFIVDDEPVSNDYNRDGKTDISVFRPSEKTWYVLSSLNNSFYTVRFGINTDLPVTGDYNGDYRTDMSVWRASEGVWYSTLPNQTQQFGANGDIPVQGDYDNDGKTDVAVFRPSEKNWYIKLSSNGTVKTVQWGLPDDIPVPADYDGDGKTDIAVFRPATGTWYILRSSDDGFNSVQFGLSDDIPVSADYDGDGKADIAVFREGVWYVSCSSDSDVTVFQWGTVNDKPVPGNYDGDSKTDFAIYRDGVWWIYLSSTENYISTQFGLSDDIPIPFVSR